MMNKECQNCGVSFETEREVKKYCSPECRKLAFLKRGSDGDKARTTAKEENVEHTSDINEQRLREIIHFSPHKAQEEILNCKERQIVICAGRRFGKSAICAYVALKALLRGDKQRKPAKIWIVSPTYDLSQKVFEYLIKWFITIVPSQKNAVSFRPFPQIKTARGGLVQCKSAENPAGLLGEELDLLIVDEAARLKKEIWESYLYPTTITRKAQTYFISTPLGKNWFFEEFLKARETQSAFQFSSLQGIAVSSEEWQIAKKKLPANVFEQEFEATFTEGAASVFRNIRQCVQIDCLKEPKAGHRYLMGLDLAKFNDFTVITVVDKLTHEVVFWDRFQQIPYTLQKERIRVAAEKYGCHIVMDSLNVGASIGDDLRAMGLRVEDFKATGTVSPDWRKRGSKELLIERLSTFLQEVNIKIPPIEEIINELESFGYVISDKGNIQYSAPQGLHDDCVTSLALAVSKLPTKIEKQNIEIARSKPHRKKIFQYK